MGRKRHHYRRRGGNTYEIDVTTFLNLIGVLLPFLLITAVPVALAGLATSRTPFESRSLFVMQASKSATARRLSPPFQRRKASTISTACLI